MQSVVKDDFACPDDNHFTILDRFADPVRRGFYLAPHPDTLVFAAAFVVALAVLPRRPATAQTP